MVARLGAGRRRSRLRLALLVLTAAILITIDSRSDSGPLTSARNVALDVLGPVRSAAGWAFSPVGDAWQGITSYDELEAENAELRAQVAENESSVLQVGEIERQRQELLGLLNAQDVVPNLPRVTARVIDAPVSNFERMIELDRGSRDGIERGMPVETGAGLVGRVVEVSTTRSRVELLTDPNFDVGVRMVRSGDDGNAEGRGGGRDLEVSFVELDTVVIPGETVVTSGFQGSSFPEGLLVGTVVEVEPNAVQGTQRVTVHPAAELTRLRWVSVILFRPDEPEPVVVDRTPEPALQSTTTTTPGDEPADEGPTESTTTTTELSPTSSVPPTTPAPSTTLQEQGFGGDAASALLPAIMAGVLAVRPRSSRP